MLHGRIFSPCLRQIAVDEFSVRNFVVNALTRVLSQFTAELGEHFRRRERAKSIYIVTAISGLNIRQKLLEGLVILLLDRKGTGDIPSRSTRLPKTGHRTPLSSAPSIGSKRVMPRRRLRIWADCGSPTARWRPPCVGSRTTTLSLMMGCACSSPCIQLRSLPHSPIFVPIRVPLPNRRRSRREFVGWGKETGKRARVQIGDAERTASRQPVQLHRPVQVLMRRAMPPRLHSAEAAF